MKTTCLNARSVITKSSPRSRTCHVWDPAHSRFSINLHQFLYPSPLPLVLGLDEIYNLVPPLLGERFSPILHQNHKKAFTETCLNSSP